MKATELQGRRLRTFEGEVILFKVDLLNKKLRNHVDSRWADVTVEGDLIIQDTKLTLGDTTAETYIIYYIPRANFYARPVERSISVNYC